MVDVVRNWASRWVKRSYKVELDESAALQYYRTSMSFSVKKAVQLFIDAMVYILVTNYVSIVKHNKNLQVIDTTDIDPQQLNAEGLLK